MLLIIAQGITQFDNLDGEIRTWHANQTQPVQALSPVTVWPGDLPDQPRGPLNHHISLHRQLVHINFEALY